MLLKSAAAIAITLMSISSLAAESPDEIVLNLGVTKTFNLEIGGGFGVEPLRLQVNRKELDQIPGSKAVSIEATSDGSVGDRGVRVKVTIKVSPEAPSTIRQIPFTISAQSEGTRLPIMEAVLTINPVYEITVSGDSKQHVWSAPADVSFAAHDEGLKIIFKSIDKVNIHRIHSNGGPITHQPGQLSVASDTMEGRTHDQTILPTAGMSSSTYYCHEHGPLGEVRTLRFNVDQKK
jgi:hypothetical protein